VDRESNLGAFGARLYSSEYGRFVAVDKLWEEYLYSGTYSYAKNTPLMKSDPSGLWDVDVYFPRGVPRDVNPYGILLVRDRHGNVIFAMKVKGQGKHRNKKKKDGDTPTGEYDIIGWITPTAEDRPAYGPNRRLAIDGVSGEIKESGRSLIRVHGGRQERRTKDGEWVPIEDAPLKNTHGCMRAKDPDMLRFYNAIVDLQKKDGEESPGKLVVTESIESPLESKLVPPQDRP
jgi:RHS repeat-associated protein